MVSLFDKIPLPNLCEAIRSLDPTIEHGFLDMDVLLELVHMDLYQFNVFTFAPNVGGRKLCFEQLNGIPMGGNTSTLYAHIYLGYSLSLLGNLKDKYGITFIRKYVDDFLVYGPMWSVKHFMSDFTRVSSLNFTVEHADAQGDLSYLDMRIRVHQHELLTRWYWKPISSYRSLHFHSKAPRSELISTYVNRFVTASNYDSGGGILLSYHRILCEMHYNCVPIAIIRKILSGVLRVPEYRLGRNCGVKRLLVELLGCQAFRLYYGLEYAEFERCFLKLPEAQWLSSYIRDNVSTVSTAVALNEREKQVQRKMAKGSFGQGNVLVGVPYHSAKSEKLRQLVRQSVGAHGHYYRRDKRYVSSNVWRKIRSVQGESST